MQILGLLGIYFDAVVAEFKKNLILFRLTLAMLCCNLWTDQFVSYKSVI